MEFQRIHENIIDENTADSMDLDEDTGTKTHRSKKIKPEFQYSGCDSAGKRLYKLAAVCLGLLCVLLLAVIIVLNVKYTAERNQLQTSNTNLTKERDQLLTSNTNLTKERNQLEKERDGLQKRLSHYEHTCPQGWMVFSSSCYFITAEWKIWSESRQDCRERGADLVIINSREEQEFVVSFGKEVWIGLTENGTVGTWNWLDGTELTTGYWMSGEPNNLLEGCIKLNPYKLNPFKSWNDVVCHDNYYGFCEKSG